MNDAKEGGVGNSVETGGRGRKTVTLADRAGPNDLIIIHGLSIRKTVADTHTYNHTPSSVIMNTFHSFDDDWDFMMLILLEVPFPKGVHILLVWVTSL